MSNIDCQTWLACLAWWRGWRSAATRCSLQPARGSRASSGGCPRGCGRSPAGPARSRARPRGCQGSLSERPLGLWIILQQYRGWTPMKYVCEAYCRSWCCLSVCPFICLSQHWKKRRNDDRITWQQEESQTIDHMVYLYITKGHTRGSMCRLNLVKIWFS